MLIRLFCRIPVDRRKLTITQLRYVTKPHFLMSGFFNSLFNSASVYVSIASLSAFGILISKWGRYSHFIKKRMSVFKSRAYVSIETSFKLGSSRSATIKSGIVYSSKSEIKVSGGTRL